MRINYVSNSIYLLFLARPIVLMLRLLALSGHHFHRMRRTRRETPCFAENSSNPANAVYRLGKRHAPKS